LGSLVRLYPDGAIDQNFSSGSGVPLPSNREAPWFNGFGQMSSRSVGRIVPGANQRLFVMGSFASVNRIDRPRLARLLGETPVTAPVPKAPQQQLDARTGTNVVLEAQVLAWPRPTFQWLHNGQAITGATGSTLALINVGLNATGEYSCLVSN